MRNIVKDYFPKVQNWNLYLYPCFRQALLSEMPSESEDGNDPCIEISDIKYDIFTVRKEADMVVMLVPSQLQLPEKSEKYMHAYV